MSRKFELTSTPILFTGLIIATVAIFSCLIYASLEEQKQWDEFAITHECKVVGKTTAEISTSIGVVAGSGNAVIVTNTTPSKTGYLCNDGITYWR